MSQSIRVATYNIWNPSFEARDSGQDSWRRRKDPLAANIDSVRPDILCLQELSHRCLEDLSTLIQDHDYEVVYQSHQVTAPEFPEGRDGVAILVKRSLASRIAIHRTSDAQRPMTHRRDVWVDLAVSTQNPNRPLKLRVATTHLDPNSSTDRGTLQLESLVKDLEQATNDIALVIICGDFNEGEEETKETALRPRAKLMQNSGYTNDGNLESTRPDNVHSSHKGHVDWIYYKSLQELPGLTVEAHSPVGDVTASDHKLVYTDFILPD